MTTEQLLATLTPRERQILDLIYAGNSTKHIARIMDISPRTVETHRTSLCVKMGTTNVVLLTRMLCELYTMRRACELHGTRF